MVDASSERSAAAGILAKAGLRQGILVSFSAEDGAGWIESHEGDLYFFSSADIVSLTDIPVGAGVRFRGSEGLATEVDHAGPTATRPITNPAPETSERPPEGTAQVDSPSTATPAGTSIADGLARSKQAPESRRVEPSDAASAVPPPVLPTEPSQSAAAEESVTPRTAASKAPARETLRGQLVSYDAEGGRGWIQGIDSKLYGFGEGDVVDPTTLVIGQGVLFHSFDQVNATCVVSFAKGEDHKTAMELARKAAEERESARPAMPPRIPRANPVSAPISLNSRGIQFGVAAGLLLGAVIAYFTWKQLSQPQPDTVTLEATAPGGTDGIGEATQQTSPDPVETAAASVDPLGATTPEDEVPDAQSEALPDDSESVAQADSIAADPAAPARPLAEEETADSPIEPARPQATAARPDPATDSPIRADLPEPEPLAAETRETLPRAELPSPAITAPSPNTSRPAADSQPAVLAGGELPMPRAPSASEGLTAWWQGSVEGNLNLNFAGHLSSRPAIVLAFDGIFSGREPLDTYIAVTNAQGEPIRGDWEVGPNRTSLILPVPPGRYHVSIGAGLEDTRGRRLGRRLGGVLRIL